MIDVKLMMLNAQKWSSCQIDYEKKRLENEIGDVTEGDGGAHKRRG